MNRGPEAENHLTWMMCCRSPNLRLLETAQTHQGAQRPFPLILRCCQANSAGTNNTDTPSYSS